MVGFKSFEGGKPREIAVLQHWPCFENW